MKIKIPGYLKEKEVWKLRSLIVILPMILSAVSGLYQFSITWCIIVLSLLLTWDTYQIILTSNTETFK